MKYIREFQVNHDEGYMSCILNDYTYIILPENFSGSSEVDWDKTFSIENSLNICNIAMFSGREKEFTEDFFDFVYLIATEEHTNGEIFRSFVRSQRKHIHENPQVFIDNSVEYAKKYCYKNFRNVRDFDLNTENFVRKRHNFQLFIEEIISLSQCFEVSLKQFFVLEYMMNGFDDFILHYPKRVKEAYKIAKTFGENLYQSYDLDKFWWFSYSDKDREKNYYPRHRIPELVHKYKTKKLEGNSLSFYKNLLNNSQTMGYYE